VKKSLKSVFGNRVRTYWVLCAAILIIQLFPYLLIGEWYGMIHYCIIFPFMELLYACGKFFYVFCASALCSCCLALLVTGVIALRQFAAKKRNPTPNSPEKPEA